MNHVSTGTTQLEILEPSMNANIGIEDGELVRIAGLEKKYPNLIKVPEVVLNVDMVL